MISASSLANEFINMLPPAETPAHTEGYEGFYHLDDIKGDVNFTQMGMLIRDHDKEKFEARKAFIAGVATKLNEIYGDGVVVAEIKDSYYNMKEQILPHMEVVDKAKKAFADAGIECKVMAIRGGTDGARLSYEGLPCPNLGTGGRQCHGKFEYASINQIYKMIVYQIYIILY